MTLKEIRQMLRSRAVEAGSQRALAKELGVSEVYMGNVIMGRKTPGPAILGPLNLRRVISYEPIRATRRGEN